MVLQCGIACKWFTEARIEKKTKHRIPGLTKMCNHTSHHAWFHGSHEKLPTYFYVKITHFPCMTRRMIPHFLKYGDFKLNNIDTFTRDVDNLHVTMEACNVWLLWYHAWRDV